MKVNNEQFSEVKVIIPIDVIKFLKTFGDIVMLENGDEYYQLPSFIQRKNGQYDLVNQQNLPIEAKEAFIKIMYLTS